MKNRLRILQMIATGYVLATGYISMRLYPKHPGLQTPAADGTHLYWVIVLLGLVAFILLTIFILRSSGLSPFRHAGPLGLFLFAHLFMAAYLTPYFSYLLDRSQPQVIHLTVTGKTSVPVWSFGQLRPDPTYSVEVADWLQQQKTVPVDVSPAEFARLAIGSTLTVTSGQKILGCRWFYYHKPPQ
ncbi:MAG: hypothetical protein ABFD82_23810 [Syntrophaceae bacterium]